MLRAQEREEKRKIRSELKEARREQKLLRKEEKKKAKEEYKALKGKFSKLPKAVIRDAADHYANKAVLEGYLNALNGQLEEGKIEEPVLPAFEETKLPSVPYDQDIEKGPRGPDNFARFRAGLFECKDKLKELKSEEKQARKSKDAETLEKCRKLREEFEEQMENEQVKAIFLTLKEKHEGKNMDEVLDLHGLKSNEAKMVLDI